ncbi:MAG: hypothetical protein P1V51_15910 [Deltaproteobacteria bacterium]|nr:hypothetical protein [Deltaproteobacteria bacterium]
MPRLPLRSARRGSISLFAAALLLGGAACKDEPAPKPAPAPTPSAPAPAPAARPATGAEPAPVVPALSGLDLEAFLEDHVRRWALKDPKNPWALAHALPITGPEVELADGQTLLEAILANASWRTEKGRTFPAFVGKAPDGTPREPHRNLTIAALYLAGVDPETAFTIDDEPATVGEIYRGALWLFEEPKDGHFGPDAWTLSAMAVAPGKPEKLINLRGVTVKVRDLPARAAEDFETQNAFLHQVRASGEPLVKQRQGVFSEPCGGWHYYEGLARWLPDKHAGKKVRPILQRITELSAFRIRAEAELYDRTHERAPAHLQRLLWIQELKFFGHYLEAMSIGRDGGIAVRPEDVDFARRRLHQAIEKLRELKAFEEMEQVNAERHQSYLDLIGDSSHALQGLRAWR